MAHRAALYIFIDTLSDPEEVSEEAKFEAAARTYYTVLSRGLSLARMAQDYDTLVASYGIFLHDPRFTPPRHCRSLLRVLFGAVLCQSAEEFETLAASLSAHSSDELSKALARCQIVATARYFQECDHARLAALLTSYNGIMLLAGQLQDWKSALAAARWIYFNGVAVNAPLQRALAAHDRRFSPSNIALQLSSTAAYLSAPADAPRPRLLWYKKPHMLPGDFLAELGSAFLPHLKQLQQNINRAKTQQPPPPPPAATTLPPKPTWSCEMGEEDDAGQPSTPRLPDVLNGVTARTRVNAKPAFKNNRWVQAIQVASSIEPELSYRQAVGLMVELRLHLIRYFTTVRVAARILSDEAICAWLVQHAFTSFPNDKRALRAFFQFAATLAPALSQIRLPDRASAMRTWCLAFCESENLVLSISRARCAEQWWQHERQAVMLLIITFEVADVCTRYNTLPLPEHLRQREWEQYRQLTIFLYCPICGHAFTEAVALQQEAPADSSTASRVALQRAHQVCLLARGACKTDDRALQALLAPPRIKPKKAKKARELVVPHHENGKATVIAGVEMHNDTVVFTPAAEQKLQTAQEMLRKVKAWDEHELGVLLRTLSIDEIISAASAEEKELVSAQLFQVEQPRPATDEKRNQRSAKRGGVRLPTRWAPSLGAVGALISYSDGRMWCSRRSARTQPVCTFVPVTAVDLRQSTFAIADQLYGLCGCCNNVAAIDPRRYTNTSGVCCAVCWHNYNRAYRVFVCTAVKEATLARCLHSREIAGM